MNADYSEHDVLEQVKIVFPGDSLWISWQDDFIGYDPLVVEAMKVGSSLGISLPMINVVKIAPNIYHLIHGQGGGIHRSRRGYEEGSLIANLFDEGSSGLGNSPFRSVQDLIPIKRRSEEDPLLRAWTKRLKNSVSYLPRGVAYQFCSDYHLDPSGLDSIVFSS